MADTDIYRKKRQAFCGSIKCPLQRLQYEPIQKNPRQFDEKNVTRLIEIFKLVKCRRLVVEHHIPARISQDMFDELDRQVVGGITPSSEPELVRPSRSLTYFRGRHRIEAAKKFLHPDDRWWTVDLYADGECSVLDGYARLMDHSSGRS